LFIFLYLNLHATKEIMIPSKHPVHVHLPYLTKNP
jgi:hypothetical protein